MVVHVTFLFTYRYSVSLLFRGERLEDRVENAIEERGGIRGGELLSEFESFIDDRLWRDAAKAQLVNRQTQDVAVDDGHAIETPVRRKLLDQPVAGAGLRDGALEKLVGEFSRGVRRARHLPETGFDARGLLPANVPLKQHLHRKFA